MPLIGLNLPMTLVNTSQDSSVALSFAYGTRFLIHHSTCPARRSLRLARLNGHYRCLPMNLYSVMTLWTIVALDDAVIGRILFYEEGSSAST